MKALVLISLLASTAYADDEPVFTEAAPTSLDPAVKPCDAVRALEEAQPIDQGKCKKLGAKKIAGLGKAALYGITEPGEMARYGFVIDGKLASPTIDLFTESAMGGKTDMLGKVTAKLRAIKVGGKSAFALDVTAHFTHDQTDPETDKLASSTPFLRRAFVICGQNSQGTLDCEVASFGGPWANCTARLSDDGILTHSCEQDDEVTW